MRREVGSGTLSLPQLAAANKCRRGYDDGENHYLPETPGIYSTIILKDYRPQKGGQQEGGVDRAAESTILRSGVRGGMQDRREFGEPEPGHGL